jgi:hypothetical protein
MEIWRPVVGFETSYEVSDAGRVRGLARLDSIGRPLPARLMKISVNADGYLVVNLCKGGKAKLNYVHRLLLEAFVGPCPAGMEGLHGDDDKSNCTLTNLRWGTRFENCADKVVNDKHTRGESNGRSMLTLKDVQTIRKKLTRSVRPETIAREYGVSAGAIYDIKAGRTWA